MGSSGKSGGGLPSGGSVGQAVINTGAGQGTWQGETAWSNMTSTGSGYTNNFADFGGGTALGAFRKDALGFVHVKGIINNTSGQATTANIFTLPAGYRPLAQHNFICAANNGTNDGSQLIRVLANGQIVMVAASGVLVAGGTVGGYISLEFTFLGEQ